MCISAWFFDLRTLLQTKLLVATPFNLPTGQSHSPCARALNHLRAKLTSSSCLWYFKFSNAFWEKTRSLLEKKSKIWLRSLLPNMLCQREQLAHQRILAITFKPLVETHIRYKQLRIPMNKHPFGEKPRQKLSITVKDLRAQPKKAFNISPPFSKSCSRVCFSFSK